MGSEYNPNPTGFVRSQVEGSDTIGDLIDFFNEHEGVIEQPELYFRRLRDENGLSNAAFVRKCHISPRLAPRVEQWCSGEALPGTRMTYLKIILGFNMSLAAANRLLTRIGCYSQLYAKNLDDAIVLYLIKTGQGYSQFTRLKKQAQEVLLQCIEPYREEARAQLAEKSEGTAPDEKEVNKLAIRLCCTESYASIDSSGRQPQETDMMLSTLSAVESEPQLLGYVREYWRDIISQHWRVLRYIDRMIEAAASLRSGVLRFAEGAEKTEPNLYAVLSQCHATDCIGAQTMSLLMTDVSHLRNHGELPGRNTLVVLGVLLGNGLDSVNRLLGVAGMEPLCVKRGIEAAIHHSLVHQGGSIDMRLLREDMSDFELELPTDAGKRMLDLFVLDDEDEDDA
ncbi:MAG: hypothetical protein E7559_05525 [Ruminococcaceae bacterium]|nr:hypothetical protein [Oscillospiraceae bacterium]